MLFPQSIMSDSAVRLLTILATTKLQNQAIPGHTWPYLPFEEAQEPFMLEITPKPIQAMCCKEDERNPARGWRSVGLRGGGIYIE